MPGKYSSFKGQVTQFAAEPEYQERVNRRKSEILDMFTHTGEKPTMANIGYALLMARQAKDDLEAKIKDENLSIEATQQMLLEIMEGEDLTNLKLTNGASLSIKDDVYCTVANKEAFYAWIESTGQQDLLTVNYMTMSSLVKKRMTGEVAIFQGEEPVPPGIETYFKQSIMVRGGKNIG